MVRTTILMCAVVCLACSGTNDDIQPAALPPGMVRPTATNADAKPPAIPFDTLTPRLIAHATDSWTHDTAAYTQGLLINSNQLLESTGLEGHSQVRVVELSSGNVLHSASIPAPYFGEGISVIGNRLYELTWKQGRAFVYDATSLQRVDSVSYDGEGWGLTTDGTHLYLSDGTSTIRVIDPQTFKVVRTIQVREAGQSVWMLNELEWIGGELWANIYLTDFIARIDAASGNVVGYVDVSALLGAREREQVRARGGVANGIAYDSAKSRVLVTGKRWPRLFALPLPRSQPR